jgi:hypothetical protein
MCRATAIHLLLSRLLYTKQDGGNYIEKIYNRAIYIIGLAA